MTGSEQLIERADAFFASGDHGTALSFYERAIAAQPDHPRANLAAARIELANQRFGHAARYLGVLASRADASDDIVFAQVAVLRRLQRTNDAIALLEGLRARRPNDPLILEPLAECLHHRGRYHEAAGVFESLLASRPQDAELQLKFADALANSYTRWEEADEVYRQALTAGIDNPTILGRAGYNLLLSGRYALSEQAIRRLMRSSADARRGHWQWSFLAEALLGQGQAGEAETAFRTAYSLCQTATEGASPIDAIALRATCAYYLHCLGDVEGARSVYALFAGLRPADFVFGHESYLPDSLTRIERLADLIGGRDVVFLLYGPSIAALDASRAELAALDACFISVNKFETVEERFLEPFGRQLDVIVTANPMDISDRFAKYETFLARDRVSMLLTTAYALSALPAGEPNDHDFVRRYDHKLLFFDPNMQTAPSPTAPLHMMPGNTLSVAMPLVAAAGARRIFLFGADGGAPAGSSPDRAYSFQAATAEPMEVKRRRETLRRLHNDAWRCDRSAAFLVMAAATLYGRPVPPVFNCSPASNHTAFPKIGIDEGLAMLSARGAA